MQHLNNDDFIVFNITEILVINYSCHYVLAKLQFIAITAIFYLNYLSYDHSRYYYTY